MLAVVGDVVYRTTPHYGSEIVFIYMHGKTHYLHILNENGNAMRPNNLIFISTSSNLWLKIMWEKESICCVHGEDKSAMGMEDICLSSKEQQNKDGMDGLWLFWLINFQATHRHNIALSFF